MRMDDVRTGPQDGAARQGRAVAALVAELRALIAAEGLRPGDSLPTERDLSDRFGVARNTVREAVGVLRAWGVVEVRPKVGAVLIEGHVQAAHDLFSFQAAINPETFQDIQGFRRLVEVGLFDSLVDRVTPDDLDRLEQLTVAMEDAPGVAESAEADFAFHLHLATLSGNRTLRDVYRVMQPVILRLMRAGKATRGRTLAAESHRALIRALAERDGHAWRHFMSDHLRQGLGFLSDDGGADAK